MKYLLIILLFAGISNYGQAQYLKISENMRYLVTDSGKPFFWLADTGWELFHRLHAGDADIYLKTRAAQGFTIIQADNNGKYSPGWDNRVHPDMGGPDWVLIVGAYDSISKNTIIKLANYRNKKLV